MHRTTGGRPKRNTDRARDEPGMSKRTTKRRPRKSTPEAPKQEVTMMQLLGVIGRCMRQH